MPPGDHSPRFATNLQVSNGGDTEFANLPRFAANRQVTDGSVVEVSRSPSNGSGLNRVGRQVSGGSRTGSRTASEVRHVSSKASAVSSGSLRSVQRATTKSNVLSKTAAGITRRARAFSMRMLGREDRQSAEEDQEADAWTFEAASFLLLFVCLFELK